MTMATSPPAAAVGFLRFVNASPTPFHAVAQSVLRLERAGFTRLSERDAWKLKAGDKKYITRNQSSIIAFTVPPKLDSIRKNGGAVGMSIVGCHTDSPRFIVKPVSKREKGGFAQVGVETYGGGLWATWNDRDLGIAGRVVLDGVGGKNKGEFSNHLFHHHEPVLRMPSVAIHLNRTQNDKYYYNPETQQVPIIALANKSFNAPFPALAEVNYVNPLDITSHHHPILLHTIAKALTKELGEEVAVEQIHDFEASLFDTQDAVIGGALGEFIFSSRIDNLFSSYCAVKALVASVSPGAGGGSTGETWGSDGRISLIALWDNEEVGSVSSHGAESNFLESVMERIAVAFKAEGESVTEAFQRCLAKSFLLSTDMAHAAHPGFLELHEEMMRPAINAGPVIKTNVKQRYASTSQTTFLLRRLSSLLPTPIPLQEFGVRNDQACGSTIGPLVAKIGLRTVDIGCPQLSMHSIREQAGVVDVGLLIELFEGFFERFGEVDTLEVD